MDFVPFDLAVKLKEKEFDCSCIGHYVNNQLYITHYLNAFHSDKDESLDAPTISQVLKWLREEKKIYIMVDRSFSVRGWHYYIIDDDDFENPIQQEVEHNRCYEQAAIAGIEYILDNLIK